MTGTIYSSHGTQVLSAFIHFGGVAILSHFLSRRLAAERLTTLHGLSQLSWARVLILLVFFDSWLFLFTSGIVIFGAGLDRNDSVCSAGIFLCIVFYATSKALIYAFLIEKVHIVWGPATGTRRMKSPIYLLCLATMLGYGVIIILMFIGRNAYIRESGRCVIGLKHYATIPLISYDLYVNIFLTILFLWPLWKSKSVISASVRHVAVRTLVAATVALICSAINIAVLAILHGHELGWVCLGSCGTDVVVNAVALFWVTRPSAHTTPRPSEYHPSVHAAAITASSPHPARASLAPHTPRSVIVATETPKRPATSPSSASPIVEERQMAKVVFRSEAEGEKHRRDSWPPSSSRTPLQRFANLFQSGRGEGQDGQSIQVIITREMQTDTEFEVLKHDVASAQKDA